MNDQPVKSVADVAAAGSVAAAGWTWISTANEILQLVATAIAIVAGVYAIVYHHTRNKALRKAMKEEDE